jgi:class 3 adenylate cyclase
MSAFVIYTAITSLMNFGLGNVKDFNADAFYVFCACVLAAIGSGVAFRLREREFLQRLEIQRAHEQVEGLLLNTLPASIIERLKGDQGAIADRHDEATVLFTDICGFTELSSQVPPDELVEFLNELFSKLDALCERHGLEKIKTIGDAYMVAGGLPEHRDDHAQAVARMALDMREAVSGMTTPLGVPLAMRIGIHTGPVVAGVIGRRKLNYDLWGDTVNTSARMESHAEPGMIQVTEATHERLKDEFELRPRGSIAVKGKGRMRTYELVGPCRDEASEDAPVHAAAAG